MQLLREACEREGRDYSTMLISVFGANTTADGLTNLFEEGITRAVLTLPPAKRDVILPLLDEWAATKDKVLSRVG
jgi:hypothetical protein